MWSLRKKANGNFYLTYDRERRPSPALPGIWEYIGPGGTVDTQRLIDINSSAGYIWAPDDEGGIRVLILTGDN